MTRGLSLWFFTPCLCVSVPVLGAINAATVSAHHSISAVYDGSSRVAVDGVVVEFRFVNPHPFLLVDVTDRSGQVARWRLDMDNRGELAGVGMTLGTFKPGERVVVTGSRARDGSTSLYVQRLDRPADGFWYEQVGSSPRVGPARR